MFLDTIHGIIERRILLNFRIDPAVLQAALPAGFRPKLFRGWGIGGVCMIRFKGLRPRPAPALMGLDSENAAHRIAVEWVADGVKQEGVFIPRRDTNSWLNALLGGRVFPGIFHHSGFEVVQNGSELSLRILRSDGSEEVVFAGSPAKSLPPTSIFPSVHEAAGFFSLGAMGYSATRSNGHYHGMELKCLDWTIDPLTVTEARSSFFSDPEKFPPGSVELDCALIMRGIAHEWHSRPDLYFDTPSNGLSVLRRANLEFGPK